MRTVYFRIFAGLLLFLQAVLPKIWPQLDLGVAWQDGFLQRVWFFGTAVVGAGLLTSLRWPARWSWLKSALVWLAALAALSIGASIFAHSHRLTASFAYLLLAVALALEPSRRLVYLGDVNRARQARPYILVVLAGLLLALGLLALLGWQWVAGEWPLGQPTAALSIGLALTIAGSYGLSVLLRHPAPGAMTLRAEIGLGAALALPYLLLTWISYPHLYESLLYGLAAVFTALYPLYLRRLSISLNYDE